MTRPLILFLYPTQAYLWPLCSKCKTLLRETKVSEKRSILQEIKKFELYEAFQCADIKRSSLISDLEPFPPLDEIAKRYECAITSLRLDIQENSGQEENISLSPLFSLVQRWNSFTKTKNKEEIGMTTLASHNLAIFKSILKTRLFNDAFNQFRWHVNRFVSFIIMML